jgi:hypothetical protein
MCAPVVRENAGLQAGPVAANRVSFPHCLQCMVTMEPPLAEYGKPDWVIQAQIGHVSAVMMKGYGEGLGDVCADGEIRSERQERQGGHHLGGHGLHRGGDADWLTEWISSAEFGCGGLQPTIPPALYIVEA